MLRPLFLSFFLLPSVGSALAADITGRWDVTISTPEGHIVGVRSFTQKGQVVTGWSGPSQSDPIPISIALHKHRLTIWTHLNQVEMSRSPGAM